MIQTIKSAKNLKELQGEIIVGFVEAILVMDFMKMV